MAIPSGYSLLGRIGYNDRGVYSENNEYVRGDVVYHEGSSYVALTTVSFCEPVQWLRTVWNWMNCYSVAFSWIMGIITSSKKPVVI